MCAANVVNALRRMEDLQHAATAEAWAAAFIKSHHIADKLNPPAPPGFSNEALASLDLRPGRPDELEIVRRAPRLRGAHRSLRARAKAAHTFLHHELQAAELMCWCLLRFPHAPLAFKQGLLRIARDEIRHMQMYREYLGNLGYPVGAFPVRDWFWQRIPQCATPLAFVSAMGLGFEAANLDHSERFATLFEEAGDVRGAALQRQVGQDEIGHVRFAAHWYRVWHQDLAFESWRKHLPEPLSPMVMRGQPLNRKARQSAGLSSAFCENLQQWAPSGI